MPQASTARLARTLPLAFALAFAWPEAADAGMFVPGPVPPTLERSAPASVAPPESSRLLAIDAKAPGFIVDAEGRSLSLTVPTTVLLYSLVRAEEVAARTVLRPAGSIPKLGLTLERPVAHPEGAGAHVGVVNVNLDYN